MFKKLIGAFVIFTMLLALCPCYTALAAITVTTSNGNVIVYARNATYTSSTFGWTDGYTKKSGDSNTTGDYLQAAQGSSSPSGSKLSFNVKADVAGRYTVWVRAKASSSNGATWFDAGDFGYVRKDLDTGGSWGWVRLTSGLYIAQNGTAAIELYPKDSGHCIDEFIVTNKATYIPSGKVTNAGSITAKTLTASYGNPSIYPPANTHPRVMFRSGDIETIQSNATKSQNTSAKSYFDGLVAADLSGTSTAYSVDLADKIEAYAFDYAVYGDTAKGNKAVTELINYLNSVHFDTTDDLISRKMGCTVFKAAEVYDWCYPLLSSAQKTLIINSCESILAGMEIGYPDTAQGNIVGHGSEAQLLRDMLAFGIAVYDERPDIYKHVMGRIQNQMVPARNYWYASHTTHQGSSYGFYRFYWDLWAEKLVMAMSGQSLFDEEEMAQVPYQLMYDRRADGRHFIQGDDSSLGWQYYNGYSAWTACFAGQLFDDAYLKGEYRIARGSENFSNTNNRNDKSYNSVFWLIVNNPSVSFNKNRSSLPVSRYFGSPNGVIYAKTGWDYNEKSPADGEVASAMMKIGEMWAGNHDHLDAGTFQLYYKGILASDSGSYWDYGSEHDYNYAKRTVAHNGLLIYDSSESFTVLQKSASNDGGQRWLDEPTTYAIWTNGSYKRGKVIDHVIASDNSYSYIKGDITSAYNSSKASKVVRAMSFLETGDSDFPAIMVVYDKVVSKSASQTKTFLLHTQVAPTISGNTTTVVNKNTVTYGSGDSAVSTTYNGRMVMKTLLPTSPTITKIGGSGSEFKVNGTNYPVDSGYDAPKYESGWGRVEIKDSASSTTTEFLNVMAVSDGDCTEDVSTTLIEGTNLKGARALNNVVMFSTQASATNGRVDSSASFTVSGSDTGLKFTIFGVKAGSWIVKRNGSILKQCVATESGATISFTGAAGEYEIVSGEMGYEPFGTDNWATGIVTEVKGNNLSSEFTRTHGGTGTARSSVRQEAITDVTDEKLLIYANDTSNTGYPCRFAHAAFRLASNVGGLQIRIRNGSSGNIQWVWINKDSGYVNQSGAVNFGVEMPLDGTDHRFDIIADVVNGYAYLYMDGQLAVKTTNIQTNGRWYGYLIYKISGATWEKGDYLQWKYCDDKTYNYTLFNDTEDHIVQWEEVITHAGLTDSKTYTDPSMILKDSGAKKAWNYFRYASGVTKTVKDNYIQVSLDSPDGYSPTAYLMGGFFHDHITTGRGSKSVPVGGKWFHMSYDQTISGDTEDVQIRVRSSNANYYGISFHPWEEYMAVIVTYDEYKDATILDRYWDDTIKVDILIDTELKTAYYFVDNQQIGGPSLYPDEEDGGLTDLRCYVKGENSKVKFANCKYEVYDLTKDFDELYAEITGQSVYWTETGNSLDVTNSKIRVNLKAKSTSGADTSNANLIAAAYDSEDNLLDVQLTDYVSNVANNSIVFDRTNNMTVIKAFCWEIPGYTALSRAKYFDITDYIN